MKCSFYLIAIGKEVVMSSKEIKNPTFLAISIASTHISESLNMRRGQVEISFLEEFESPPSQSLIITIKGMLKPRSNKKRIYFLSSVELFKERRGKQWIPIRVEAIIAQICEDSSASLSLCNFAQFEGGEKGPVEVLLNEITPG